MQSHVRCRHRTASLHAPHPWRGVSGPSFCAFSPGPVLPPKLFQAPHAPTDDRGHSKLWRALFAAEDVAVAVDSEEIFLLTRRSNCRGHLVRLVTHGAWYLTDTRRTNWTLYVVFFYRARCTDCSQVLCQPSTRTLVRLLLCRMNINSGRTTLKNYLCRWCSSGFKSSALPLREQLSDFLPNSSSWCSELSLSLLCRAFSVFRGLLSRHLVEPSSAVDFNRSY